MVGTERENPQDEQVEGALEQVGLGHETLLSGSERSVGVGPVQVKTTTTDNDNQVANRLVTASEGAQSQLGTGIGRTFQVRCKRRVSPT